MDSHEQRKHRLMTLSTIIAPSGAENAAAEYVRREMDNFADEVTIDVMGNLIFTKKGSVSNGQTILLQAALDEPGLMIIHIEDSGYARIAPIGGVQASTAVGQLVRFTNGTLGVIGAESHKGKELTWTELFVDVGAISAGEGSERIFVGLSGSFAQQAQMLTDHLMVGKSLGNRAAAVVLMEVLATLSSLQHDVQIVFSTQKEVEARGIRTAAFSADPVFAVSLGCAPTGDTPKGIRSELRLGAGPAFKIMDGSAIIPSRIRQDLINLATDKDIQYQLEINPEGRSDAGPILLTRAGVLTAGIDIPVRHQKTVSEIVDIRDIDQTIHLILELVRQYDR